MAPTKDKGYFLGVPRHQHLQGDRWEGPELCAPAPGSHGEIVALKSESLYLEFRIEARLY